MLTIKQLNQKIAGIAKSAKSLRDNIQVVLCSAAAHAYVHGDVTSFDKLFAATSGVNRKKMVKWITDNGFARLGDDGTFKVNKKMRKEADFKDGIAVVQYLTNQVPAWYIGEQSAKEIAKDMNIAQLTAMLAKRISEAKEKGINVVDTDPAATAKNVAYIAEASRAVA